jgi:hypothetical protein
LTRRKEEWAANLARKEALIGQAEALVETQEWSRAIDEIKRLQAEWKAIGPVRKNRAEDVWQRFRGACDRFFERYQQRDHVQVAANVAQREEICREMEGLLPPAVQPAVPEGVPGTGDQELASFDSQAESALAQDRPGIRNQEPATTGSQVLADLADRVNVLRKRWQQAPVLMPRETLAQFTARFNSALTGIVKTFPEPFRGSDLDPDANLRKAEDLCLRVERQLPPEPERTEPAGEESPATILAARLREALATNTIGGAVAVADAEAKWKGAVAAVRDARAAWSVLGPLPAELDARFERACRRVLEAAEKQKR